MLKNKTVKTILIIMGIGILIAGGVGYYMFNMPHRDVQATSADYQLSAKEIVGEYLNNSAAANEKYLDEEGESKVLVITGKIASISTDFNDQKVVLLKNASDKAGVNCTFLPGDNIQLNVGDVISVKGVIRSGASYDEDLEMYENVILDKCSIVNNKS
jgi:flagellar basal body-associated protein FliL